MSIHTFSPQNRGWISGRPPGQRRAVQNRRITELQKLIGEVPVAQPSDRQFIDTRSRKAEAESRRMAMNCELMVIERNIKLFHTTLSSLDKPVRPISDQLVCSTDKTDAREEVSAALQNNHLLRCSLKERIESQNTIIQECIAEEQNNKRKFSRLTSGALDISNEQCIL